MVSFKRIHHVSIRVKDIKNSQSFYENHFGFETYFEENSKSGVPVVCLRLEETVLELRAEEEKPDGYHGCYFCIETDDVEGAFQTLDDAGVILEQGIHQTTGRNYEERRWRRVVFKGPDGELIEIRGR